MKEHGFYFLNFACSSHVLIDTSMDDLNNDEHRAASETKTGLYSIMYLYDYFLLLYLYTSHQIYISFALIFIFL